MTEMIRICYIIGQLGRGGAEKQLFELIRGIDRKLYLPIVCSLNKGGYWGRRLRELNVKVVEISNLRGKSNSLLKISRLINLLIEIRPHIVHCYMFTANFYGRLASIVTRVPIIIASKRNAEEIGKDKTIFRMFIDKLLSRYSDGIVCNSNSSAINLVKKYGFDRNKIFAIHNGIRKIEIEKLSNLYKDVKRINAVVGTIGSLTPRKNQRLFLEMVRIILERTEDSYITFNIIGEGWLRKELEKDSKMMGIESNVLFLGERNDIYSLLMQMDVFVMTSLYEGLSNAIMEAMMAGLPVVASNIGGNNELVVHGKTGFLCGVNNAQAFAKYVLLLINNRKLLKRMGESGRQRIIREFGTDIMVNKTEEIYQKLLVKSRITHRSLKSISLAH